MKYAYIMIIKPKYNIDIILLIINFYLTCESIWKLHFYFTIDVYVLLAYLIS